MCIFIIFLLSLSLSLLVSHYIKGKRHDSKLKKHGIKCGRRIAFTIKIWPRRERETLVQMKLSFTSRSLLHGSSCKTQDYDMKWGGEGERRGTKCAVWTTRGFANIIQHLRSSVARVHAVTGKGRKGFVRERKQGARIRRWGGLSEFPGLRLQP